MGVSAEVIAGVVCWGFPDVLRALPLLRTAVHLEIFGQCVGNNLALRYDFR